MFYKNQNTHTTRNKNTLYLWCSALVMFLVFISPIQAQNAVTPQGNSTNSGSSFVDKNGRIVAYTALTKQGEELFKCCDPFTDPRDGNTYNIVRIGNQCWMAENLKYLPSVVGPATSDAGTAYYYVYGYNGTSVAAAKATANYSDYGVLYNFMAATDGNWMGSTTNPSGIQGPCPSGWHVPSLSEWTQMTNFLSATPQYWCDNNSGNYAKSLASTSGWANSVNTCAVGNNQATSNSSGFNVFAGGFYNSSSSLFDGMGLWTHYRVTDHLSGALAQNRFISSQNANVQTGDIQKANGHYIRCVRDDCPYLTTPVGTSHTTSPTQIQWNWGAVTDATGYKISTANDYSTATDIGLTTTYAQSVSYGTCGEFTLYIWAYNNCGVSNTGILIEDNSFTDVRDGKEYTTVQVGNQCWMKENLNYAAGGSWCYDNNSSNCDTYGRLYNWTTLMNGSASSSSNPSGVQGQCPDGWHLPSDSEWTELTAYLEGNSTYWCGGISTQIAVALANDSGWLTGGTTTCDVGFQQTFNNSSGFSALPSGQRQYITVSPFYIYNTLMVSSYFYTSTEHPTLPTTHSWVRNLRSTDPEIDRAAYDKNNGYSARCVRD